MPITPEASPRARAVAPAGPLAGLPAVWAPVLLLLPLAAWIESARRLYAQAGAHTLPEGPPPAGIVALALALGVAAVLVECAFLRMVWAARGVRLPFAPLAFALGLLTVPESCAQAALAHVAPGSAAAVWLAPWVGYRALAGDAAGANGWSFAFAGAGLLTAARIAASAAVQSRLAGRRWREAALLVTVVWLLSHVLLAWLAELARGRALGPA
ncbi:MAG: hypothetical protein HZA61_03255 [Candidatus Eisenbacteria bacterium]|uniref:Uncharacterized protein n=1 Tax=Eiseniibacteriota bacterium TaxID=2212470 RepID=A0A933SC10_UNCEI|nr:hypothetical protein [Candidatus Eisenbacteria bacterium]